MKFLLMLLVLAVAGWFFLGRRRPPAGDTRKTKPGPAAKTETMLACAHCGVHLPQAEAKMDAAGRPYCGDPHRLLGPR